MKISHLFSVIAFISLNVGAATELYQWVDENGVKHFSQQPPAHLPGLQASDVHGTPVISGSEPQLPEVASSPSELPPEPVETEVERIENPEKNAEQCEQAKKNIKQLIEFRRVRAKDQETGELRYLDDDEKETQMKNWRKRESTYC